MAVSYKKLWKLLIDKEMMKKDLRAMTGVSTTTMSRLSKDENVSTEMWEISWNLFLIKKRSSKEVREHGSFLSLYCVFDQRAVPFLRNAFYRKANGRRKFR